LIWGAWTDSEAWKEYKGLSSAEKKISPFVKTAHVSPSMATGNVWTYAFINANIICQV
jgi:hypothetical protein